MPKVDDICFIGLPARGEKRALFSVAVLSCDEDVLRVKPQNAELSFDDGMEVLLFFDQGRDFMQQSAQIVPIELGEFDEHDEHDWEDPGIGLKLIGTPISAEHRESYRVRTADTELSLDVEEETNCPMLDVSSTGFAFKSETQYRLGKLLSVVLRYDGNEFRGKASVQSLASMGGGAMRYGVRFVDAALGPRKLATGLAKISLDAQRKRVRGGDRDH